MAGDACRPATIADRRCTMSPTSPASASRPCHGYSTTNRMFAPRSCPCQSAAVSLGFRRNIIAKNLRTGSATSSVGLVIADLLNPFYGAIATAVEAVANRHAATMILGSSAEDVFREQRIVTDLLEGHVDGLIVVPTGGDHSYLNRSAGSASTSCSSTGRQADRCRRGRPRQRRRGAIGDPPPAEPRPSPDRVRRRLGDPGDGPGAAGRLSAGPRRGRASSSIRRSSGSVRREPSWPRSSPGSCSRATIRRPRSSPRTTAAASGSSGR